MKARSILPGNDLVDDDVLGAVECTGVPPPLPRGGLENSSGSDRKLLDDRRRAALRGLRWAISTSSDIFESTDRASHTMGDCQYWSWQEGGKGEPQYLHMSTVQ